MVAIKIYKRMWYLMLKCMKLDSFIGKYVLLKSSQDTEKFNRSITFELTENVAKRIISKIDKYLNHFTCGFFKPSDNW